MGGKVFYNEHGEEFAAGSKETANVDVETILKNYRIGNTMADVMEKRLKEK